MYEEQRSWSTDLPVYNHILVNRKKLSQSKRNYDEEERRDTN